MTKRVGVLLMALLAAGNAALAGPVLINEILYDAVGTDAPFAFTELTGCPGAVLDGWSLVGVNGSSGAPYRAVDLSGAVIPFDGLLVVATARAEGDVLQNRDFIGDVDWQNGPDAVELWDPLGVRVDAVQYGALGGVTLGEGSPAPDTDAGWALTRDFFGTDTDDNALDFAVAEPTPGSRGAPPPEPAPVPLPEPRAVTLMLLGLGTLWLRRANASAQALDPCAPARHLGRMGAPWIASVRTMTSKPSKR